jgi:hypothetical protein
MTVKVTDKNCRIYKNIIMKKIAINEPTTVITNIIISMLSLLCGLSLFKIYSIKMESVHLHISIAYCIFAFTNILAGIFHGFHHNFSQTFRNWFWGLTLILIGMAIEFFLLGMFLSVFPIKIYFYARWAAIAAMTIYGVIILRNPYFKNCAYFCIINIAILFCLSLYSYFTIENYGAFNILIGLIIFFIGAALQGAGFSPHQKFNHNDLFHIFIITGGWFLYKGVILLNDFKTLSGV